MGYYKELSLRQEELQHYPSVNKHVCADCIGDAALAEVVEDNLCSDECDYCGATSDEEIAAHLSSVTEHMAECISQRYTDPVHELGHDSQDGGYQGEVIDGYDLIIEIGLEVTDRNLWDDILSTFSPTHWCKKEYYALGATERLAFGWDDFCKVVKHQRRFTFWSMGPASGEPKFPHPDDVPVGKMLDEIADSVVEAGLIKTLDTSTPIWRVRVHDSAETITTGNALGSPPVDYAKQANRMSPAGIPMFYGSADMDTAIAETFDPKKPTGKVITGGMYTPTRQLKVLDLHQLPSSPSFWRLDGHDLRDTIDFLYQFQAELSKPIERGKIGDIEYVPTQAFSEYVRYHMQDDEATIDGISYSSSKNGMRCYVIFCENEQCDKPEDEFAPEQILSLDLSSLKSIDAETVT